MAKTRAKDRIRLSDGSETTLGEALDSGRLSLVESTYYDPPRYFAREQDGDNVVSWEVGKALYASRTGTPLPFKNERKDER